MTFGLARVEGQFDGLALRGQDKAGVKFVRL
jgi:hypothetical protein